MDYPIPEIFSLFCFPVIGWVKARGGRFTLRSTKVDDVSVLLEHVNLLDGLDGLDVHLLQGGLELFVVGTGGLVDLLDLAAGSTLASGILSVVLVLILVGCVEVIECGVICGVVMYLLYVPYELEKE